MTAAGKYLFLVFMLFSFCARSQTKIIGDCTIDFTIQAIDANGNADMSSALSRASKTLYIKGKQVRSDFRSENFFQSVIANNITNTAVILRDVGENKYMTVFDEEKWKKHASRYEGMSLTFTQQTKSILGYTCKKAEAHLKDGSSFIIFYVEGMDASSDENPYQFKNVPGLVLEYESQLENSGKHIRFTATKITFDPVPASKFEIPSSGYRLLE